MKILLTTAKVLLLGLVANFYSIAAFGQAQISGRIVDVNEEPIPFANVLLLNAVDSTLQKGTVTDTKGFYELTQLVPGKYFIQYSIIGFQSFYSRPLEISSAGEQVELGTQTMQEGAEQLNEVVVVADKPLYEQKLDRLVVNVAESPLTKGSSVLQVLERSPGIFLDRQNNNLMLNGKNGVMVMINEKLVRLSVSEVVNMLTGMNADNIQSIELLTTPPAKYDAEGSAGMINIVTKKNENEGTRASTSITGGYGWGEKFAGSVNVSHSREKIRLYGSNDYNRDRTFNRWFADVDYNVPVFGGQIESGFLSRTEPTTESHNANFGFDAYLTSRTTLGASVRYNNSDVASAVRNTADYLLTQSDSLINVGVVLDGNNVWDNVTSNVYLEQKIGKGSIQLDYDYLYFKNENTSQVQTSFSDDESNEIIPDDEQFSTRQRSLSNTPISINVVKLDYSVDLNDEVKLETGVKGTLTASDSESGIQALVNGEWVNVGSTTTDLDMDETVAAFYTSFNVKVSPTVNINAGVRYEYSDTEVAAVKPENEVDRELSELFPSLFLSKKINDDMDLNFSYSRRISRPTYNDLASTVTYSDPTSVYSGNPLLRPTITNTVKMDYRVKDYSFSLSASRDDNPIARFQITRAGDIDLLVVGPVNVDYQNNLTFQTNIPYKITDWWTTNQGFVGGWRQFRLAHTAENVEHTYFGFNLYGSQTFSLPKGYSLELSGWFNSASFNGSVRVESFGALNLGLKKDLPNNMGSFQFSVSDLLKSINITSGFGSLTREAFDVSSSLDFMAESARARIVKFTYSKSFGGNKVRGKKWRGSGSQDEENRVLRN